MDIFNIFGLFKDTTLVDISSHGPMTYPLPKEIEDCIDTNSILSYDSIIDNYSNQTLNSVLIQVKFKMKFQPLLYNQDKMIKEYTIENKNIKISNIYPKEKLYLHLYPNDDDKNIEQKPIIYINGNLLGIKTKFLNIFYNFFRFKFLAIFFLILMLIPVYLTYISSQKIYVLSEETKELVSKKELINQKLFNYYRQQGLNPMLVEYDIVNTPNSFYEQEELKNIIKDKCNDKILLNLNSVKNFDDLFKKKQIMICK